MRGGAGVGRTKSDARTPSACLATPFLIGSPRSLFCACHSPLATGHCSKFLSGTGSHIEFAANHSKQKTAPSLTGARTTHCHARSSIANALSNRELQLLEPPLTHTKQTIAPRSNRELSTNRRRGNSHAVIPVPSFLPGSGPRVECAVTHSKQTTGQVLPGSRIATTRFGNGAGLFQEAGEGFGGGEFGDFDVDLGALAFLAADVHFELIAVEQAQAFVDVADADASSIDFCEPLGGDAHSA